MSNKKKYLSSISYHDYALLIAHLDYEQVFQLGKDKEDNSEDFRIVYNSFSDVCKKYRKNLIMNAQAFHQIDIKSNKGYSKQSKPKLSSFLYNPVSFVSFGNTDSLQIVGIEDFDLMLYLTSEYDLPIKQISYAFCPTLKSLGINNKKESYFCEIDDICNFIACDNDGISSNLFVEERPLIGVSYYKLHGMAILGPGLLFQQSVYKAMINKINETLKKMCIDAKKGSYGDKILLEDVKSFRCMLIDPQGWSDIATLMLCKNYSVIVAVLTALRSLTFQDLYNETNDEDGTNRLQKVIKDFEVHERLAAIDNKMRMDNPGDSLQRESDPFFSNNQIFGSTSTTLSISNNAFNCSSKNEAERKYHGFVYADPHLTAIPGYLDSAKAICKKSMEVTNCSFETHGDSVSWENFEWCTIGAFDFTALSTISPQLFFERAQPLFMFVQFLKEFFRHSIPSYDKSAKELGILDIFTELQIPIPKNISDQKLISRKDHRIVDEKKILAKLGERLFKSQLISGGIFNIDKLRQSMKILRLPSPLSSRLVHIYSDFARALKDHFLFENILDLLDIFEAVYRLFTKELPNALKLELKRFEDDNTRNRLMNESISLAFLDDYDLHDILELLEFLKNSLTNRTQMGFREIERWQATVGMSGAINKLVNAADTPMMCGLYILKRIITGDINTRSSSMNEKELEMYDSTSTNGRVGGASRVSFNVRTVSRKFNIGKRGENEIFLAALDLNIAQIIRPEYLCSHFHEMAHLICDLVKTEECPRGSYSNKCFKEICFKKLNPFLSTIGKKEERERYEEIFSEMLVFRLIFDKDYTTFFRNYMAHYFLDPISICVNDSDTLLRMTEVLIRSFLAVDPYMFPTKSGIYTNENLYQIREKYDLSDLDVQYAKKRFVKSIMDAGPLFSEFIRLISIKENKKYIFDQFERVFIEGYPILCCIWDEIENIVENIVQSKEGKGIAMDPPDGSAINEMIENNYARGQPIIRNLYDNPRKNKLKDLDISERYSYLNATYLVRRLLYLHIKSLYGKKALSTSNVVCLARDPYSGDPDPSKLPFSMKGLNKQLLDRNFNGLISADLKHRRNYIKSRITIIKTFWDLSTNFRARRFNYLLKKVWPDIRPDPR